MTTYYETLEVQPDANDREITKAFRKQALRWHPDKNRDNQEEAEKKFKLIGEAYETLRDSERRRDYDQYLESLSRQQEQQRAYKRRRRSARSTEQEEQMPRWERHETNREDVEELLKLATTLLEDYLKEQERRKDLGKQLVSAIKDKRYDEIPELIQNDAFLDEQSDEGLAGIHYAVKRNEPDLLAYLMSVGANVNTQSRSGNTALHITVKMKNYELSKALVLTYRADTHQQNYDDKDTPLHYAIEHKRGQQIQELLINHSSTYRWLFSRYSALDCQDLLKDTPLHLAVKTKQFDTVRLLLKKMARTDLKNQDSKTAIDLMREIHHELPINLSAWLDRKIVIQQRESQTSNCLVM